MALASCDSNPPPPTPTSTTTTRTTPTVKAETGIPDETRAALIRQTVPSMTDVDTPSLIGLVGDMCRQLSTNITAKQIFQTAVAQKFTPNEAFGLLSVAVVTTCPSNVGRVTYDTLGWHP